MKINIENISHTISINLPNKQCIFRQIIKWFFNQLALTFLSNVSCYQNYYILPYYGEGHNVICAICPVQNVVSTHIPNTRVNIVIYDFRCFLNLFKQISYWVIFVVPIRTAYECYIFKARQKTVKNNVFRFRAHRRVTRDNTRNR